MVDEHRIVVNDILNEKADELPEFCDRVIQVSLGGCHDSAPLGASSPRPAAHSMGMHVTHLTAA